MCSDGVSVWFACKLCKSFFLNADDFAYHKKKYHVQEFRSTKFIVFEEQTTPAASPPENWVSFLSPKEETRIHKIISLPSPSNKTIGNYPSKERIQSGQNEKLIEIGPESEKYFDGGPEVSKNSFDSINQNNVVKTGTQSEDNPYVSLKRLKFKNPRNLSSYSSNSTMHSEVNSLSNVNLNTSDVITVNKPEVPSSTDQNKFNRRSSTINFPPLPTNYKQCNSENFNSTTEIDIDEDICRLKKQFANILCVPCLQTFSSSDELNAHNLSFHSTSAVLSPDLHHQTELAEDREGTPKTKVEPEEEICFTNNDDQSSATNLPVSENWDGVGITLTQCNLGPGYFNADDVSNNFNHYKDNSEEDIMDEASNNKQIIPSTSESILPDDAILKTKFSSGLLKCRFCFKKINSVVFQMHTLVCKNHSVNQNWDLNISSDKNQNLDSTNLEVNFSPKDHLATTEYTDGYEDREFSTTGVDQDPFEYESRLKSSSAEKEILIVSVAGGSSHAVSEGNQGKLPPKAEAPKHCVSCNKYFVSFLDLTQHNKKHHMIQGGKLRFKCPHSNCETTARDQYHIGMHLMQVHSNARLFKCPHPECEKSFKTTKARNRHFKRHTKLFQSGVSNEKSNK